MGEDKLLKGDFPGHPFRGNQHVNVPSRGTFGSKDKRGVSALAGRVQAGKGVRVSNVKAAYEIIDYLQSEAKKAAAAGKEAKGFNLCKVTVPGTNLFCGGNKGIERAGMPQLGGHEKKFVNTLKEKGVSVKDQTLKAVELKATQNELVGTKVAGMMNNKSFNPRGERILVSKDGYVVDGHHRWASQVGRDISDGRAGDLKMNVTVIDMPIVKLIQAANKYADGQGLKRKSGKDTGADLKKAQPTPSDVHVDAIFKVPKKKKKKKDEKEINGMMITKRSGGLSTWFREDWVDISRPKKGGGFEPCGRPDASSGKYPKCVPASKAAKMTPEQIRSAVSRKRKAESSQKREGKKPINVSTFKKGDFPGHPFRGNQHTGGIPQFGSVVNRSSLPASDRKPRLKARIPKNDKGRYDKFSPEYKKYIKDKKSKPNWKETRLKETKEVSEQFYAYYRQTRPNATLDTIERLTKGSIYRYIEDEWGYALKGPALKKLYNGAEKSYLSGAKRNQPKKAPRPAPKPKDKRTPAQKRKDTMRAKMTPKERKASIEREQAKIKAEAIKRGLAESRRKGRRKEVESSQKREGKPKKISRGNERGRRDKKMDEASLKIKAQGRRKRARRDRIEQQAIKDNKGMYWTSERTGKTYFRWIKPGTESPRFRGSEKIPKKGYKWADSNPDFVPKSRRQDAFVLTYDTKRQGWKWVENTRRQGPTGRATGSNIGGGAPGSMSKGDYPGHPFRGNQYVRGISGKLGRGLGVARAVGSVKESATTRGSLNPMTPQAKRNLKKLGKRVPQEELEAARRIAIKDYNNMPKATKKRIREYCRNLRNNPRAGGDMRSNTATRQRRRSRVLKKFGDGHTCPCTYCGIRLGNKTVEMEKIDPVMGYSVPENVVPSCRGCNSSLKNVSPSKKFGRRMTRAMTKANC